MQTKLFIVQQHGIMPVQRTINIQEDASVTAHLFIVNEESFITHLKYQFAGTGGKFNDLSFLTSPSLTTPNHFVERNLVAMIADVSRVKKGDKIIFFVTGISKFFGIFEATSDAFLDIDGCYLEDEIGKKLNFRVMFKPYEIFAQGVTEHTVLDSIADLARPCEMIWSLIYRKLKGNRGCTQIFENEFLRIRDLLLKENNDHIIMASYFVYNPDDSTIEASTLHNNYCKDPAPLDIKSRLLLKATNKKAFEVHLQAFLLQNIDVLTSHLKINRSSNLLIGNEVSCGVGMQSIDILLIEVMPTKAVIYIIELKDEKPSINVAKQLTWYINWCNDYLVPNLTTQNVLIQPVVVAENISDESTKNAVTIQITDELDKNLDRNSYQINEPLFICFKIDKMNNDLVFLGENK